MQGTSDRLQRRTIRPASRTRNAAGGSAEFLLLVTDSLQGSPPAIAAPPMWRLLPHHAATLQILGSEKWSLPHARRLFYWPPDYSWSLHKGSETNER
jgi:hypothetical protein